MTYLGPGSPGLEVTTASVTIDPALASADPTMMAAAVQAFASAAHQIHQAGQASVRASAQLASDWSGKGKDGFDAASSKLNAGAKLGADSLAATSSALQTLSIEIAAAKAMAHKAQMMATDSARAATLLQSAYASSSQQAVQALPPDATTEQALAARAPTAGQVAQANTISTDAAQATQLMAQANTMAREAWDKAAAAFQAVTATFPMRTVRTSGHPHPKAKVSADQVRIVTQADGQRVYSFDGGLKIPVDMPGAHHLVEDIKAYMPRFLAGDHGGLRVPADLSAKGLWFLAASFWVSTTMHDIPEELRNVFFTARFSSITMTELIGAGLTGLVVGGAYVEYQTGLFSNAIRTARATAGGSTSLNESARDPTPTSGNIPTSASQVTDEQALQADHELGTGGGVGSFSSGRGPMTAKVTVTGPGGQLVSQQEINSGGMTEEQASLGFPRSTLATHVEAKAVSQISLNEGDTMSIEADRPPCPSCRGLMNRAAKETGARIVYTWGGKEWRANP